MYYWFSWRANEEKVRFTCNLPYVYLYIHRLRTHKVILYNKIVKIATVRLMMMVKTITKMTMMVTRRNQSIKIGKSD